MSRYTHVVCTFAFAALFAAWLLAVPAASALDSGIESAEHYSGEYQADQAERRFLDSGIESAEHYSPSHTREKYQEFNPEKRDQAEITNWEMNEITPREFLNQFESGAGSQSPPQKQMNRVKVQDSPDIEKHNEERADAISQTRGRDEGGERSKDQGPIAAMIRWWWEPERAAPLVEPVKQVTSRKAYLQWPSSDHIGENEQAGHAVVSRVMSNDLRRQSDQDPNAKLAQTRANQQACSGSQGSAAGECAKENLDVDLELATQYLINVANEAAGSPTSSRAPVKSYENAVWMVQKMYKQCYVPMAILFLLPGAIITNVKTLVSFGILNARDEDTVNPFSGIFRSIIAVFLIPATQLFVSYVIDTGNALEHAVSKEVNVPLILFWAAEQMQTFSPDQQGGLIKDLPSIPHAPYRGKFAGMPVSGGIMEQMSGVDITMLEVFNELAHLLTEGLSIMSAFQVVFMCYLFLLGPLAAAFFAWPTGIGRDLFRKAFATWMDGVVILALWKFWWNIVLLCMTVRLESEGINIFDVAEVYLFIAFMAMLLFVPFNPFDFKAGEIVTHLLEKAQQQAGKVASNTGAKGGGSTGGTGATGAGAEGPMAGSTVSAPAGG